MKGIKKILILALAVLACAGTAEAKLFSFGVKAGLNVNKVHFNKDIASDIVNPDNSTGWTAGIMGEVTVPVIGIAVDASLMYTRMNNGCNDERTSVDPNKVASFDSETGHIYGRNFLEIPINVKYKFNIPAVAKIVKPMVYTGPSFAFKLDKNIYKNFKTQTCEVGWNLGIGFEFFSHLQVSGGYTFGLNNILDGKIADIMANAPTDLKARNNYWTVTAAYLF